MIREVGSLVLETWDKESGRLFRGVERLRPNSSWIPSFSITEANTERERERDRENAREIDEQIYIYIPIHESRYPDELLN